MHSRWLKTRRHFYESLRQEIQMITGPLSVELQIYKDEYEKAFDGVWDIASMQDLMSKILKSRFVLAGDFHYFYQSQRTHLRMLRNLKKELKSKKIDRSICISLEVFDIKDQKHIDDYLASKVTLEQLFRLTHWQKKWLGLPLKGYEVLLSWAKAEGVKVFGINDSKQESLPSRDSVSGDFLNRLFKKDPERINYVIYGDFHLAESHLPAKIVNFDSSKDVILYLNSDKLYFELSEHAIEDQFDVLQLKNCFCILSSTPWVKLQSYLVFLQDMDDQMISEIEGDDFEPNYTDYLGKVLDIYAADFDLPDWKKYLDILTPGDLAFEKLDFLKLDKEEKAKLGYFVTAQKNLVFPKDEVQFLAKPSVNSAYSLVGEFIHSKLSFRKSLNWSGNDFMQKRIWIEAVSFFFNLWLNPTVKSLNETDLTPRLRSIDNELLITSDLESEDYAESVLRFAVDYKLSEVESKSAGVVRKLVYDEIPWAIRLEAASILGKILGKKLYKRFKSGTLTKDTLLSYLSVPIESANFNFMYNHLLISLDKNDVKK